ncbi:hypothetical protein CPB83DRAFT_411631 [Crepidotus variabilis]|uniref:F-box domain-containing protein n=1 Tax=Crepidotus variabilis TaxID=179855 RepID=A0A9P6ERD3_9AGAR|nr:hypothetical protein CPB83DRAFT_411631 [Crepidotus variabilis]
MGLNSTTMILDRDLSMRSSLLSLPNEVLQKILEFAVHEDQAQAKSRYQAHSFQEFYFNRKANQESAYRIRFVCKRIDGAVVKYLFREVKIRLGWDYLSINPPLRELAEGVMGRVFRENARTLILDQILLQNSPRFEDDRHRDHERNRDLPTEVWYHYPEPMTKEEKTVKYEELKEEVYRMLSVAMVSMSKLVEIRYKSDMQSSAQPLGVAFSSGLSALSNIETLKIQAEIPLHDNRSQKSSLEKHLQAISGLKNLHTLEFSVFSRCNLRIDLDDLWRAMQAANIQLRSLSVDDMSPRLLEYLASFTGLYNLTLSPLPTNHIMGFGDNTQEEMAVFFFNNVTMRHSRTLSHLAIAGKMPCWSINNHNIFALARCQSLTSLAIPFCIMESDLDSDIRTSMVSQTQPS